MEKVPWGRVNENGEMLHPAKNNDSAHLNSFPMKSAWKVAGLDRRHSLPGLRQELR